MIKNARLKMPRYIDCGGLTPDFHHAENFSVNQKFQTRLYPRFFSGRILFGALVLPENPVGFGAGGICGSFAAFEAANNLEFSSSFAAVFALLLGFFFTFVIYVL